jgi:5,5'-dehydrodivanillate O-demethylase
MDNSLDPIHFEHLHGHYGNYVMKKIGRPQMINPRPHKKIEFDVFEYGIYKRRLVEGASEEDTDWTVGHPILFPYILSQGGPSQISCQLRVPADDTHTTHIAIMGQRPPEGVPVQQDVPVRREPLEHDTWGRVFAPTILPQDEAAWIGQGAITDRTSEHLVTSDKGILLFRRLLRENMEAVARGDDPMGVIRDRAVNEPMIRIARGSTYVAFREGVRDEDYGGVREPVGAQV